MEARGLDTQAVRIASAPFKRFVCVVVIAVALVLVPGRTDRRADRKWHTRRDRKATHPSQEFPPPADWRLI